MNYIQKEFLLENKDQGELLVALLSNQGFDGFEETEHHLKAFIDESLFSQTDFDEVIQKFSTISYNTTIVENVNWNATWESSFEPVIVHDFVAIRANFHAPVLEAKHQIIITPKMSFGTGHHATTYLMIAQMEHLTFLNKTVFDFGTGTGVLAILAEKLGASNIDAIDIDEWSIENTKENIAANNCQKINLWQASHISTNKKYDIILANINYNIISENLKSIFEICNINAAILFSGFLKSDEENMKNLLLTQGFTIVNIAQKLDWICIYCVK